MNDADIAAWIEEIEEEVKEDGGTDADLKKDRNTGVTIVDYTELL